MTRALLLAVAMSALASSALAEGTPDAAAGSGEPVICTDRPTKSSNACTVDPGRLQLETDLFNGTFQRLDGVTTDTWLVTNPTLKYGLAKSLDVEINIAPYQYVRTHDAATGTDRTVRGVGDLYLRLKYLAYSSKGDAVQLGLYPFLKAPTAPRSIGNGAVEGGVVAPINLKLNDTWQLGFAPELDLYKDAAGSGRHANLIQTVNVGYGLPHDVTLYGELWGDFNFDPAGEVDQYSADVAVSWAPIKSLQLDAGLNFGLNRQTPGVQAYVGVSKRF